MNARLSGSRIKSFLMPLTLALTAGMAVNAVPLVGRAVGTVIARSAAHEAAETATVGALKTGAKRAMGSSLRNVSAKKLMGAGVAVGTAIAIPRLAEGSQSVQKARADAIRSTSEAAVREMPNNPELVAQVLPTLASSSDSTIDHVLLWFSRILLWVCGFMGLGILICLVGYLRRAVLSAWRSPTPKPVVDDVVAK